MSEYLSTRKHAVRFSEDYYAAFDRIYAFRRDLRGLLLTPARWERIGTQWTEKLESIRSYQGETYDVCSVRIEGSRVTRWGSIQDQGVRRLIRHNVNRVNKLSHTPEIAGLLEPLKAILQAYAGSATRIVIVSVPFGPGHRVPVESAPIARYVNELAVAQSNEAFTHWTAFDVPFFQDCSNFFDFRHLNRKGRLLFSEWLAARMAPN
jgi:hypothetical protein